MSKYEYRKRQILSKLNRANEHYEELKKQLQFFISSNPYEIGTRINNENKPVYFISSVKEVPERINLITGDLLHNLVCALDHLAYQLVCHDTNDVPHNPYKIYFPVFDTQGSYDLKRTDKMPGAKPETLTEIDKVRPFKDGNRLLWILQKLNNIDKHRLLLTVGAQAGGIHLGDLLSMHTPMEFRRPETEAFFQEMPHVLLPSDNGFPIKPGFELYMGGVNEPISASLRFKFDVVINESGIVEGEPLIDFVDKLTQEVNAVIVELLKILAT